MPYSLRTILIAKAPVLEIDEVHGKEIIHAWRCATSTARIEDLWENVVQSYIELESEMLQAAVHNMIVSFETHDEHQRLRLQFGRRLSAYLHFAKAYLEQTCIILEGMKNKTYLRRFRYLTDSAKSDENYRFMYSLRNFTQHSGLAVHGSTLDNTWSLIEEDGQLAKGTQRYRAQATIELGIVRQGRKFDRSAFRHLPDNHRLDAITVSRKYMEKLSSIHSGLRDCMADSFSTWKAMIRAVLRSYEAEFGHDPVALRLAWMGEPRSAENEINLFDEMLTRTETMIRRNRELKSLQRRYVSSALE